MQKSDLETILQSAANPRFDIAVRLGNTSARLVSNRASFPEASFFSRHALLAENTRVDHELWCIDDPCGSLRARIQSYRSTRSYRAACFEIGYYATDHFGEPVVLHRFANRHYVIGEHLERVVWPYFVKFFIFAKSLDQGQLFVKAASVAFAQHGVLILGRGLGGKTTFVRELCRHGAAIVTNSHAIVDGLTLTGVRSTMRVRPIENIDAALEHTSALRDREVLIDPFETYPAIAENTVRLESLCIVDYRPGREEGVRRLEPDDALGFVEQFSLGLNVYRLEEEMLEFYDHDLVRYGRAMRALRNRLQSMVHAVPCYLVRTDILDRGNLARVCDALGWPWSNTI